VDSLALERCVLDGPLAARMLTFVRRLGLVGLAMVPGALRYPLGVTRALAGPEDYKGATIGIRPSRIEQATFEALGARARLYPTASLARLDGADVDLSTIATDHYELQARALTANVPFWPRALVVVMNREAFEALTPEEQGILRRAGRAAVAPHLAELRVDPQGWLVNVCPRSRVSVVAASAADRAALLRAVEPVYDRLRRDPLTRDLIAGIRRLRREAPPADRVRCGRVTPLEPSRAGPFDGRWQATLTRADLLGQGASKPFADQLRGRWVAQFVKGRFEFHNPIAGADAGGRFVVRSDVVQFVFTRGIGLGSGRSEKARWSIYRNRLSFEAIRGPGLIGLRGPWERAR
jgi:hypothetical protein